MITRLINRYFFTKYNSASVTYHKAEVAVVQFITGSTEHTKVKTLTKPYYVRSQ